MNQRTIRTLSVQCEVAYLKDFTQSRLYSCGFHIDSFSSTKLVLDFPLGYGQSFLKKLKKNNTELIVVTWNPSREYVEDIWDLGPEALLAGEILWRQGLAETLPEIISRIRTGDRFRLTPGPPTSLTRCERLILRHVALGWTNKRIAEQLHLQEQTVKNTLRSVYRKLNVRNHSQAALYYWGIL